MIITNIDDYESNVGKDSEFTMFNKALMAMAEKFAPKKKTNDILEEFIPSDNVVNLVADPAPPPQAAAAAFARRTKKPSNLFEEFIKFMYDKVNEKNVTRAYIASDKLDTPNLDRIVVNDPKAQIQLNNMERRIRQDPVMDALEEIEDNDGIMKVHFS